MESKLHTASQECPVFGHLILGDRSHGVGAAANMPTKTKKAPGNRGPFSLTTQKLSEVVSNVRRTVVSLQGAYSQ